MNTFDRKVRLQIQHIFMRRGRAPTVAEVSKDLSSTLPRVRSAFRRLAQEHALVLQENGDEILRAAPFWAAPTPFEVEVGRGRWWGSCIWDALGIPAMLKKDGRIVSSCGCCSSPMVLRIERGLLSKAEGVIHFAVPASRWYENVVFT